MSYSTSVHHKAIDLTRLALEMTAASGSGHPTSAASLAHVTTVLMYDLMRFDPRTPDAFAADRLVLSEGHACPIVYAAAADLGISIRDHGRTRSMTRDDAMSLREIGSPIDGHPNPREGFPFFPAATGSLGQGLSVAVGLGIAAELDGIDKRVYSILGDGESREGQVWEAVDMLAERGLRSVCAIFNCNGYGQTAAVSEQQSPERVAEKLRAFGLDVRAIDGHDPDALRDALHEHARRADSGEGAPIALVLRTTKGWGSASLQGGGHHGKPATGDDLEKALRELDATAKQIGAQDTGDLKGPQPPKAHGASPAGRRSKAPARLDEVKDVGDQELASRDAFGPAIVAAGRADPRIVVLDGDVADSTRAKAFAKDEALAPRFVQCRIAEQHMMSCAAGLAAGGKIPFVTSFGKFLIRGYDQLEMALIGGAPLKLVGSHTGVSLAADGPSQMALPDVAFCRALSGVRRDGGPLIYVLNPSDARAAYALTIAAAEHDGAVYVRTMRPSTPFVYPRDAQFRLGGFHVLREGEDVLLATWGYMVHECRRACDLLAERGVAATLVDLYSIPFEADRFVELAAGVAGPVLTVEDNYGGGLGSEVADVLASAGHHRAVEQMFVRTVPKSAREPEDLIAYLDLDAEHIAERAERMLAAHR